MQTVSFFITILTFHKKTKTISDFQCVYSYCCFCYCLHTEIGKNNTKNFFSLQRDFIVKILRMNRNKNTKKEKKNAWKGYTHTCRLALALIRYQIKNIICQSLPTTNTTSGNSLAIYGSNFVVIFLFLLPNNATLFGNIRKRRQTLFGLVGVLISGVLNGKWKEDWL